MQQQDHNQKQIDFFTKMHQHCFFQEVGLTYLVAYQKRIICRFWLKTLKTILTNDVHQWKQLEQLNFEIAQIFQPQASIQDESNWLWSTRFETIDQTKALAIYHYAYEISLKTTNWHLLPQWQYLIFVNDLLSANQSQYYWKFNQALSALLTNQMIKST